MTEEIIIDGVNVAGCEHYCEKINTGSGFIQNPLKQGFCLHNITGLQNADIYFRMLTFPKCREQSNCYYKQLKRLEQKRDELKKACEKCKLLDIEKTNRDLLERIDKLEQENKELKEMLSKEPKAMQAFQTAYHGLKKENEVLWGMIKDYKTALEEIRGKVNQSYQMADRHIVLNIINEVLNVKY